MFQRPATAGMSGAGKQSDQRRARIGFGFTQNSLERSVVRWSRFQRWETLGVLDFERNKHVEIAID